MPRTTLDWLHVAFSLSTRPAVARYHRHPLAHACRLMKSTHGEHGANFDGLPGPRLLARVLT